MSTYRSLRIFSEYVQVSASWAVLVEIHELSAPACTQTWLGSAHKQEIMTLLRQTIEERVDIQAKSKKLRIRRDGQVSGFGNQTADQKKLAKFYQPKVVTGELVRLSLCFRKREVLQKCLTHNSRHAAGHCSSYTVLQDKLVVHAYHAHGYHEMKKASLTQKNTNSREKTGKKKARVGKTEAGVSTYFQTGNGNTRSAANHQQTLKNIVQKSRPKLSGKTNKQKKDKAVGDRLKGNTNPDIIKVDDATEVSHSSTPSAVQNIASNEPAAANVAAEADDNPKSADFDDYKLDHYPDAPHSDCVQETAHPDAANTTHDSKEECKAESKPASIDSYDMERPSTSTEAAGSAFGSSTLQNLEKCSDVGLREIKQDIGESVGSSREQNTEKFTDTLLHELEQDFDESVEWEPLPEVSNQIVDKAVSKVYKSSSSREHNAKSDILHLGQPTFDDTDGDSDGGQLFLFPDRSSKGDVDLQDSRTKRVATRHKDQARSKKLEALWESDEFTTHDDDKGNLESTLEQQGTKQKSRPMEPKKRKYSKRLPLDSIMDSESDGGLDPCLNQSNSTCSGPTETVSRTKRRRSQKMAALMESESENDTESSNADAFLSLKRPIKKKPCTSTAKQNSRKSPRQAGNGKTSQRVEVKYKKFTFTKTRNVRPHESTSICDNHSKTSSDNDHEDTTATSVGGAAAVATSPRVEAFSQDPAALPFDDDETRDHYTTASPTFGGRHKPDRARLSRRKSYRKSRQQSIHTARRYSQMVGESQQQDAEEAGGLFSDCVLQEALSTIPDLVLVKVEGRDDEMQDIHRAKKVSDLTEDQITYLVKRNEKYLRDIFQGKTYCRRHEDYKKGGTARVDLAYQMPIGCFTDDQCDQVMALMMDMFCKKHHKYVDYVMKVMQAEMMIKIFMDAQQVGHDYAEKQLLNTSRDTDSHTE